MTSQFEATLEAKMSTFEASLYYFLYIRNALTDIHTYNCLE
jgi:hypothetical protein